MLPMIVNVNLTKGSKTLAKKKTLVKNIQSIQNLGAIDILCTDKTGTLTQNKMKVVEVKSNDKKFAVELASLCTDCDISVENGEKIVTGEATEKAIVDEGVNIGKGKDELEKDFPRIHEVPFDSNRKMMTTIHRIGNKYRVITKGAPDVLLARCTKEIAINEKNLNINNTQIRIQSLNEYKIKNENQKMAQNALRVIAIAYKDLDALPNKIDSNTISFGVAPRINACGRMGKAEEALELFLSKDKNEVNELTNKLNEHNRKRQETEKTIFENAVEKIKEEHLDENKAIIVGGENWHHGVIGIVSSKITEMYFKPSILFSFEEDGIGKGSGRSIPGFDLHEALMKCSDTIEKFGGHSMAVGITVKKDNLEKFKKEFEQIATQSKIDEIIPIINIDAKVDLSDIDKEMVESLKQLEPFGEANKMPVFAFKNLKIDSIRALSEGKHLKLTLKDNNYIINAIGFNIGYLANEYRIGDKIDVAGVLEINTFNGVDNLQINIKDIMKSI